MSGYLQYSNYGDEDEKQTVSTKSQQPVVQPKRTLRTNQRTLRSKQSLQQPQQPQQQSQQSPQQPPRQQPASQHKYVQELIQKIHNSEIGGSDSESDADGDENSHYAHMQHMQQQFQTEPVPNRNRFTAANNSDLNAKLNPASTKEAFTSKALANQIQNQYQQFMPSVFQASGASAGEVENKDIMLQKLDRIISLLEDQHDEKTGHVTEELVLYCFLGVFIIFIVDSFARAGKYVR